MRKLVAKLTVSIAMDTLRRQLGPSCAPTSFAAISTTWVSQPQHARGPPLHILQHPKPAAQYGSARVRGRTARCAAIARPGQAAAGNSKAAMVQRGVQLFGIDLVHLPTALSAAP
jgi:hypothetical protein